MFSVGSGKAPPRSFGCPWNMGKMLVRNLPEPGRQIPSPAYYRDCSKRIAYEFSEYCPKWLMALSIRCGLQVPTQFCVCNAAGIRDPLKADDAWLAISPNPSVWASLARACRFVRPTARSEKAI